jgi:hypothetical protein
MTNCRMGLNAEGWSIYHLKRQVNSEQASMSPMCLLSCRLSLHDYKMYIHDTKMRLYSSEINLKGLNISPHNYKMSLHGSSVSF